MPRFKDSPSITVEEAGRWDMSDVELPPKTDAEMVAEVADLAISLAESCGAAPVEIEALRLLLEYYR